MKSEITSKTHKIVKKTFLKTNRFSMSIFHQFLMDSRPQNRPKMRSGMPPSAPRALMERLLHTPGAKKASRTRFVMVSAGFWIDLGSILEGFGHQKGSQSTSKTYKICFLASHALSSSSKALASQPQASNRPRRDSRSVNNARGPFRDPMRAKARRLSVTGCGTVV